MKRMKQINIFQELRKIKDHEEVDSFLKEKSFKDFAEEMDFVNNELSPRYRKILFGYDNCEAN